MLFNKTMLILLALLVIIPIAFADIDCSRMLEASGPFFPGCGNYNDDQSDCLASCVPWEGPTCKWRPEILNPPFFPIPAQCESSENSCFPNTCGCATGINCENGFTGVLDTCCSEPNVSALTNVSCISQDIGIINTVDLLSSCQGPSGCCKPSPFVPIVNCEAVCDASITSFCNANPTNATCVSYMQINPNPFNWNDPNSICSGAINGCFYGSIACSCDITGNQTVGPPDPPIIPPVDPPIVPGTPLDCLPYAYLLGNPTTGPAELEVDFGGSCLCYEEVGGSCQVEACESCEIDYGEGAGLIDFYLEYAQTGEHKEAYAVGSYVPELIATDSRANQASDNEEITANASGSANCSITSLSPDTIQTGQSTTVNISYSNFAGNPLFGSVACKGSASSSNEDCAAGTCTVDCGIYDSAGTYNITASLDNSGAVVDCGNTNLTVNAPPGNQPPTADLTANPNTGNAPLDVEFIAICSDPEGVMDSCNLIFGDGSPVYSFVQPTGGTVNHTYAAGTYIAVLTASDGVNLLVEDTEIITVETSQAGDPQLQIVSFKIEPSSIVLEAGTPKEVEAVVKVRNIGGGGVISTKVELEVIDSEGNSGPIDLIESNVKNVGPLPEEFSLSFEVNDLWVDNIYAVYAKAYDTEAPPNLHDSKIKYLTVALKGATPVPELNLLLLPLLAISVLFILSRKKH